jgi:hypothetical protein
MPKIKKLIGFLFLFRSYFLLSLLAFFKKDKKELKQTIQSGLNLFINLWLPLEIRM